MDFWDLTKLVFRRWFVAVPLLIITGLAAAYMASTVKPDYKATAYVQLIPPPEASITTNIKSLRNPWLDLGLGSLNTAATYATVDRKFLNSLSIQGMSDNVVIENGYPAPIATVEVIGTSKEQATDTASAVVTRFNEVVKSLQDDYAVKDAGRILTRRLDTGNNLEETGGKVKRALVAVAGAGVLLTLGVTVLFDALMRGRKRRREDEEIEPTESPIGSSSSSGSAAVGPTPKPAAVAIPGDRTVKISTQAAQTQVTAAPRPVPAVNGANGHGANGQNPNGQNSNGQNSNGQNSNGQKSNGKSGSARVNGVGRRTETPQAVGEGTIVIPGSVYRSGHKPE